MKFDYMNLEGPLSILSVDECTVHEDIPEEFKWNKDRSKTKASKLAGEKLCGTSKGKARNFTFS